MWEHCSSQSHSNWASTTDWWRRLPGYRKKRRLKSPSHKLLESACSGFRFCFLKIVYLEFFPCHCVTSFTRMNSTMQKAKLARVMTDAMTATMKDQPTKNGPSVSTPLAKYISTTQSSRLMSSQKSRPLTPITTKAISTMQPVDQSSSQCCKHIAHTFMSFFSWQT